MTAENSEKVLEGNDDGKTGSSDLIVESRKDGDSETLNESNVVKEESKDVTKVDQNVAIRALQPLYKDPSFAIICSFFNRFSTLLGLKPQNFPRIEQLFTSFHETGRVDRDLIDLHLTLLRKLNFKSARAPAWEKFLLKFCSLNPTLQSEFLKLERFGYLNAPPATKLSVLKALCEAQFDFNLKFKETISSIRGAANFRLLPVGSDYHGLAYWYQQDSTLNIRVYTEEPDDHSGNSWSLVAKSKEDLEKLLEKLKAVSVEYGFTKPNVKSEVLKAGEKEKRKDNPYDFEVTTKRGDILDVFRNEFQITKPNSKDEKGVKAKRKDGSSEKTEKGEEKTEEREEFSKEMVDRRVLPRRSARNVAINHLKELTSPVRRSSVGSKDASRKRSRSVKTSKVTKEDESVTVTETAPSCNDENEDSGNNSAVSEEDDDEEEEDSDDQTSDDDFMPLSEIKKKGVRSRKGRREGYDVEDEQEEDEDSEEEIKKERKQATLETLCQNCKKSTNPEVLLLCDMCDDAWHTGCLHPMLWFVPDGDWFCPKCHHYMLIDKFTSILTTLTIQLKNKIAEDKRKEAAAERLKREMEYIGVSVNKIIPQGSEKSEEQSEASEQSSDFDDGERQSKRRANRRLGVRPKRPVVPIALGRSRRHVAKVDYNFGAYDELIREAMENIDASATKPKISKDPIRPQGGAGRGKDMSNILNAEQKRQSSVDTSVDDDRTRKTRIGKPPKTHHRLNDLDVDEMTESESDEYKASEDTSEGSEDVSDDFDEYVPSDEGPRRSSRRRKSDDDFVVSGSESDYTPTRRTRRGRNTRRTGQRRRGKRSFSSDEDDSTSEVSFDSESDSSVIARKKRRSTVGNKWAPRASSSEEGSEYNLKTSSGRPLRKAARKNKAVQEISDDEDEEESGDDRRKSGNSQSSRKKHESDEEAYSLSEEDEEEEEDEDVEEEEDVGEEEALEEEQEEEKSRASTDVKVNVSKEKIVKEELEVQNKPGPSKEEPVPTPVTEKETGGGVGESISAKEEPVEKGPCNSSSSFESSHLPKKDVFLPKRDPGETQGSFVPFKREVDIQMPSTSRSIIDPTHTQIQYTISSKVPPAMENPSVVMQQMAQLASATPMPHYIPIVSPSQAVPAASPFPGTLGTFLPDKIAYGGPPPGPYSMHPLGFARIPPAVAPTIRHVVPSETWQQCPVPQNVFAPPSLRVPSPATVPTLNPGVPLPQNPSDPDSLSNALASAMEY